MTFLINGPNRTRELENTPAVLKGGEGRIKPLPVEKRKIEAEKEKKMMNKDT